MTFSSFANIFRALAPALPTPDSHVGKTCKRTSRIASSTHLLIVSALLLVSFGATAATYPQPYITSFSPESGPVGTVVTINGSGFQGLNAAWVGSAKNAGLQVLGNNQVKVTIPTGATTGAIGILNPKYASFTPRSFTVSTTATTLPQPYIMSFSPESGPVGTVVTINGSGFLGLNAAWVGSAKNAGLQIVGNNQVKVTVPAGATTGAIGILNPKYASFTPRSFTVTATSATLPQQTISGFSPASGPVGTVITVNGSGFTGSNAAWVGAARNAAVTVVSDAQARITVPTGATSGQLAILNAQYSALSPATFTVTTAAPVFQQQSISSISPVSGPVGTVISITGTGFTGSNAAWVGAAQNASLQVISNTSAKITVPTEAQSGKVAILNPQYSAFSAGTFTVTTSTPPPPPPPAGQLSIRVSGNRLINTSGAVVQLRGVNYSGFEFVAIQGWNPADPSGAQAGQPGGPKWSAMQSWKINTVRIPLNEASWLGRTCTDTSGVVRNADPGGNYKSAVKTQVDQATAAGLYVILDLHWSAPGNACPMLQTQMANADHSLTFWTSVAGMFKSYPSVIFELFNEPFMDFDFSGDAWAYMMKGTGGSFSGYPATGGSGVWKDIKQPWAIASYQAMINSVRATGATNVVLVGAVSYAQDLSGWLANKPTDPLNQMAAAWHPYRKFNSAWDYPYPNYHPQVMTDAQNILAAGIPLIMTEVGAQNTAGTPSSPIITTMTQFADANGISVLGWSWDVWGEPENVLIKDVNGTPTDGYGQVLRNWFLAH